MISKKKSILIWVFTFIFTLAIGVYQRMTGPTYPVHGHARIANNDISYKLIRTSDATGDQNISITVSDTNVKGRFIFKRYKSYDEWTTTEMVRKADELTGIVPHQPPAGKVMYKIELYTQNECVQITSEPVVIRFKGWVPLWILLPHILFMFMAMLYSTRTGLEALFKGSKTFNYSLLTVIFLFIGGAILGPVMQKYAFDAFWTGWPVAHDLTDNKTALALLIWIVAFIIQFRRNNKARVWIIAAAIILLAVYMVPHSVLGSEIDYTQSVRK